MNFLAHLYLAGDDDSLRLGAMLGDFVRGRAALEAFDPGLRRGIRLHRHIDQYIDAMPRTARLRESLAPPFRRYGGIIIDLGYDHELARNWAAYSPVPLETFDRDVRSLLARHAGIVPKRLRRFMEYADRRGLFAAYRDPQEVLYSLQGIGRRLTRPNPLHRVSEIWDELEPQLAAAFVEVLPQLQTEVAGWLKSESAVTET